ncbi:hypothetical protein BS17DRAFT_822603 [Gyrodon lividus]|nr:hypothetical protein BS17DRAFT_822603 [Gyrodon lividus]
MASLFTNLVPVFISANWLAWYRQMELFLMAQGLYYVITDKYPSPNEENDNTTDISEWNHHNTQAIGNLHLRLTPNILAKVLSQTTASSIWSLLKDEYGTPGVATAYTEFKAISQMGIISPKVQAMILLAKLPSSMDTITHLISQEPRTLTSALIEKSATLAWEQHSKPQEAQTLSAVKRKQPDPKFNQQQQPQQSSQQGGSNGSAPGQNKGKTKHGSKNCNQHNHNHLASTAISTPPMEVTTLSMIDPHCLAHTPSVQDFGPPAFKTTLKAFDLLHQIGVTLSYEGVCTIETCLPSDPAPEVGPSAKCPCLEERISTASFTAEDDAISMASRYKSNDIYNMYIDCWACE